MNNQQPIMKLEFRRFQRKEYPEYTAWFQNEELNNRLGPMDTDWLEAVLSQPETQGITWAIYGAEEFVAVVETAFDPDGHLPTAIPAIAVKPELQGKGIGKAVLQQVLAMHQARGKSDHIAFVATDNLAARKLLESVGFVATSQEPDSHGYVEFHRTTQLVIEGPRLKQSARCEPIMRALPDWFGIEEAIVQHVAEIENLPTFLVCKGERTIGFLSMKQHNPYSAEIHVLAILREMHRQGLGRQLLHAAEAYLRDQNVEYLHLKTLSDSHPDEDYAKTRAFYRAVGFRPLAELPTLWGKDNPCLVMVKRL